MKITNCTIGKLYGIISFLLLSSNVFSQQTHVLITSSKGYSERFSKVFEHSSLHPVAIPMIETIIPERMEDMDSLISHIYNYKYIAFSSRKAIQAFADRLDENMDISGIKFCAIGKDTEYMHDRLANINSVEPNEPSPMGIARKLAEDKSIKGKTIAVLVPLVREIPEPDVVPDFLAELEKIGMNVTRINAYITQPADRAKIQKAVKLIASQQIKCIAFTSSAEIEILLQNIEDKSILNNVVIACFGPYTAAFAKKKGLNVSLVAKDFSSFSGFLKAIEDHF
ncbi:MAG: uroporphyrinogen-III synthase [Dysgonomonas sp.]|nr:uroporphyrinogen-III synthase [Dysgonomonas sp.]